jgi:hypothetical protein
MSRLVIAIGYADRRSSTPPELVYLGRDASAMRTACDASPLAFFTLIPFAMGIPKANRNAAANAAGIAAARAADLEEVEGHFADIAAAAAERARVLAALHDELATGRADWEQRGLQLSDLLDATRAKDNELATLRAELARVTAPPPEARHSPQGDGGPAAPAEPAPAEAPPPAEPTAESPAADATPPGKRRK